MKVNYCIRRKDLISLRASPNAVMLLLWHIHQASHDVTICRPFRAYKFLALKGPKIFA